MRAQQALMVATFVSELQALCRTHHVRLVSETRIRVVVTDGSSEMSDVDVVDAGPDYMVIE